MCCHFRIPEDLADEEAQEILETQEIGMNQD